MVDRLKAKSAILFGAARGIGAAMAEAFVDEGAAVVIADTETAAGEATAAALARRGPAAFQACDVSDAGHVRAAVDAAVTRHGGLDAGQFRHGPLELLGPNLALVLLRAAEPGHESVARLGPPAAAAGVEPLVFDATGATTSAAPCEVLFERGEGFAAALAMLPALQALVLGVAERTVDRVGEPRYAQKVRREV